jgi:voltage-gated potassium channel
MENKWRVFVDVLTALSVIAIIIDYVYSNLSIIQKDEIYIFDLFVVAILAIDFYGRIKKSTLTISKFLIKHWYEIPSMMPLVLFSTLEHEFLIGTVVRSIRLLRLFRIVHLFFRTLTIFKGNRLVYIMIFAFTSILLGAFAEYIVESSVEGAKIITFGDALWWSITTVTTVGYGDIYPVTTEGRIIASILMIIGIMVLGLFISTLGSSLIESRLAKTTKKQNTSKIKDDRNIKKNQNDNNSNNYTTINEETKILVKNKIDSLESLGQEEFDILIKLIKTLYYKKN